MHTEVITAAEANELAKSELMRGVPAETLARFKALWKHKVLQTGETMMAAQQPGNALYFVLSGTVKIHVEQHNGSDVFIDICGAGDTVGEMSIVDNVGRSATATAMEETHVLWMGRQAIEQEMAVSPIIAQNIARILSGRLRHATERIQVMATRDTFGRVAHQLHFFCRKYGRPTSEGILIPIRLTQGDLADLVGATRERVNRVMGDFKRQKIVTWDARNYLIILDAKALERYANE